MQTLGRGKRQRRLTRRYDSQQVDIELALDTDEWEVRRKQRTPQQPLPVGASVTHAIDGVIVELPVVCCSRRMNGLVGRRLTASIP